MVARDLASSARKLRKQVLLPSLGSVRVFATQKCHHCKERAARVAQRIVERLPIVAVLAIVVGDHVLELMRLLQFLVGASGTAFDLLQVLEREGGLLALRPPNQLPPHHVRHEVGHGRPSLVSEEEDLLPRQGREEHAQPVHILQLGMCPPTRRRDVRCRGPRCRSDTGRPGAAAHSPRPTHKLVNILDKLPGRLQPRVKTALHEVMYAETREQAREAITRFAAEYGPKYPKAVTTLEQDADALLTFFDFPGEHWKHLRTSNVIESPFATVRLRQRVTKGACSRTKGLLMAYKLLDMAQARWRRLDGAHLLSLVRAGITFVDGVQHATTGRRSSTGAA